MARPRDPERLQKFSRWLRGIAPARGFDSQRQLAIKAGINEATVSRIWNATQLPDEITLVKIAQALDVEVAEALTQAGYPVELVPITTEPLDPSATYMNDPASDEINDLLSLMSPEEKEAFRRLAQSVVNRTTKDVG